MPDLGPRLQEGSVGLHVSVLDVGVEDPLRHGDGIRLGHAGEAQDREVVAGLHRVVGGQFDGRQVEGPGQGLPVGHRVDLHDSQIDIAVGHERLGPVGVDGGLVGLGGDPDEQVSDRVLLRAGAVLRAEAGGVRGADVGVGEDQPVGADDRARPDADLLPLRVDDGQPYDTQPGGVEVEGRLAGASGQRETEPGHRHERDRHEVCRGLAPERHRHLDGEPRWGQAHRLAGVAVTQLQGDPGEHRPRHPTGHLLPGAVEGAPGGQVDRLPPLTGPHETQVLAGHVTIGRGDPGLVLAADHVGLTEHGRQWHRVATDGDPQLLAGRLDPERDGHVVAGFASHDRAPFGPGQATGHRAHRAGASGRGGTLDAQLQLDPVARSTQVEGQRRGHRQRGGDPGPVAPTAVRRGVGVDPHSVRGVEVEAGMRARHGAVVEAHLCLRTSPDDDRRAWSEALLDPLTGQLSWARGATVVEHDERRPARGRCGGGGLRGRGGGCARGLRGGRGIRGGGGTGGHRRRLRWADRRGAGGGGGLRARRERGCARGLRGGRGIRGRGWPGRCLAGRAHCGDAQLDPPVRPAEQQPQFVGDRHRAGQANAGEPRAVRRAEVGEHPAGPVVEQLPMPTRHRRMVDDDVAHRVSADDHRAWPVQHPAAAGPAHVDLLGHAGFSSRATVARQHTGIGIAAPGGRWPAAGCREQSRTSGRGRPRRLIGWPSTSPKRSNTCARR